MYLKNKDDIISFRVPHSMRDSLQQIASQLGMSLSMYVRFIITFHLREFYDGLKDED